MRMQVTGGSLNVRQKPTTDSTVNHVLANGEIITVGPEKDGWCSFGSGYVMAKWLAPVDEEPVPIEETELKDAAREIREAAKEIKAAARSTKKTTKKKAADK